MFYRTCLLLFAGMSALPAFSQSVNFNIVQLGQTGGPVVGDFNADGREDMIVFSSTGTAFHLRISTGYGTYTSAPSYTIPNGERNIGYTVGDFNRDGKLDLAIITNGTSFYEFLGNGDGSFHSPSTHALGFAPPAIVAADVNSDAKMDLVVLDATNNNNTVIRTYLGDGSGGFSAGPTSSPGVYAYALWTGDFDADGKVDVLYAEDCNPSGCLMGLSYGDGAGHFGSATTVSLPLGGLTIADVDGDGKSDIIMSTESYIGPGQQYLSVFYGSATRALESAHIATTQCTFGRPAVADFNGDHIPDIIFSEDDCSEQAGGNAQVAFMPGQGNRLFGSEQTVVTSRSQDSPGNDTTVLRANNGDTKPDFLFSQGFEQLDNKEYLLMVNETSGTFAACRPPNTPTGFRVCSPASGSTVSSPVKFSFGAAGQVPMRKGEVWVDGAKKAESLYAFSHYAFLDSDLALSSGTHNITLYANGWDNSVQKKSFTITVSGTGGSCSAPTSDGIHVCNPENGSTVSSPVAINATARVSGTIYRFELWLGSTKLASVSNSTVMQTSVNVPSGTHTLNFVAVNTAGTGCGTSKCRQSVSVTVK